MSATVRVAIAPGGGLLARRPRALMFVPGPDADGGRELIDRFVGAPSDEQSTHDVTDALVADGFRAGPFVMLTWGPMLRVFVFGPVELRTDAPALPMISGAGSTSWVERHVVAPSDGDRTVEVTVGDDALAGTDVGLGSVLAGGFRATLVLGDESSSLAPAPSETPAGPPTTTDRVQPDAPRGPLPAPAPDPTADVRRRGLEALQVATGGDWMEDSLGLRSNPSASPSESQKPPPPSTSPSPVDAHDDADDEITLAPEDLPDHNAGNDIAASDDDDPHLDDRAVVRARMCPRGHANPLHVVRCRACDAEIADLPTAKVPQPALAALRLPDGSELTLDRTYVLGRRPDIAAARLTTTVARPVDAVEVTGDPAISRTHVAVSADDWTITVTDCGSRSGTAMVASPGHEPVTLEPWVSHEAPVGATIYLGGPTAVSVAPCAPPAVSS